jgi:RNA polymerase subunit RPABC4/transcription elongation factor Spt4
VRYAFKGVWDAGGKVVKQHAKNDELMGKRYANSWDLYCKLTRALGGAVVSRTDWIKLEKELDDRIHQRGHFVVDNRFFGLVVDTEEERKTLSNEWKHIVFADRNDIPDMKPIEGTQTLHSVDGHVASSSTRRSSLNRPGTEEYLLTVAEYPCVCLICRDMIEDKTQVCPFKDIRKELQPQWRGRKVAVVATDEQVATNQMYKRIKDAYRLANVSLVNVKFLKEKLEERQLSFIGIKKVLAKRLLDSLDSTPTP